MRNTDFAHRGLHDKPRIPENSMAAFKRAVKHGFGSELDVHLLKDGHLAVIHDDSLKRTTGEDGYVEDCDSLSVKDYRLEGTKERIPLLEEVLALYEKTGLPLLIEIKTARGNNREITAILCDMLDSYKGRYYIESFDPRAIKTMKELRPWVKRGQLVQNFVKRGEKLSLPTRFLLSSLLFNHISKPHFIAYRFSDRYQASIRRARHNSSLMQACWTIDNIDDYKKVKRLGAAAIFEGFIP